MLKIIISAFVAFVLLSGCQKDEVMVEVFTFSPSDYHVLFIPDFAEDAADTIYMDAILDLKATYPTEFVETNKEERDLSEIGVDLSGPILIIQKDGKNISEISGEKTMKEIRDELEHTLINNTVN